MAFNQHAIVVAHGVLGCLAWVIFFPLGSILMRVLNGPATWKVHTAVQVLGMAMFTASLGTGLQMARRFRALDNYHVIIGLLIFALMFIQAFAGILHHYFFKSYLRRTVVSHVHLWLGRILITFGMINGALGLKLQHEARRVTSGQIIAYSVVTALIWLVWVTISAVYEARKTPTPSIESDNSTSSREKRGVARERRLSERREVSLTRHKEMQVSYARDSQESV